MEDLVWRQVLGRKGKPCLGFGIMRPAKLVPKVRSHVLRPLWVRARPPADRAVTRAGLPAAPPPTPQGCLTLDGAEPPRARKVRQPETPGESC